MFDKNICNNIIARNEIGSLMVYELEKYDKWLRDNAKNIRNGKMENIYKGYITFMIDVIKKNKCCEIDKLNDMLNKYPPGFQLMAILDCYHENLLLKDNTNYLNNEASWERHIKKNNYIGSKKELMNIDFNPII